MKIYEVSSIHEAFIVISKHAIRETPFECCGIILGSRPFLECHELTVVECTNIQNDLHVNNPDQYSRDARFAYYIDPREQNLIFEEARKKELIPVAIYHSHVNHELYFSVEDEQRALWNGEPVFPNMSYIVISIHNKKVKGRGVFIWNNKLRVYEQQVLDM